MAEKDILEKVLLSHADVFADCVNTLAYEGNGRLAEADLQPAPTESFYQGKEKTRIRHRQVLRKASCQGGACREQLDSERPVYPVIGMVLDWTQKTSRIPLSLRKLMQEAGALREELALADDVDLAVCHMRNLPGEVRDRFTSGMLFFHDMGFVADYLNEGSFEGRKDQPIRHMEALCAMMEALTGDARFTEQVNGLLSGKAKREEVYMCEYIDMLEARGEKKGEKRQELYRRYNII